MTQIMSPDLQATLWLREKSASHVAFMDFKQSKHFHSLDGLRCLSILAVIWHHVAGDQYASNSLFFLGHHGVTLFFVISGFLITSLLLREKQKNGRISLPQFYMRRALRIFPVYYLVLFIYCVLVFLLEKNSAAGLAFFDNLIYFATYTSNYFVALNGDRVIFYFAWSLAAEEQFYMVWPTIENWLSEKGAIAVALIAILVSTLATQGMLLLTSSDLLSIILENIAIPICIGVLLAHAMNNEVTFVVLHRMLGAKYTPLAVLILALMLLTLESSLQIFAYLLFAALVFCSVTSRSSVTYPVLNHRWLIAVGQVSYGMYMFHMLSLNAIRKIMPSNGLSADQELNQLVLFLLTSLLTFVVAKLSFRYFESYFLRKKVTYTATLASER